MPLKMKKPNDPCRGHLGQQTLGQRFATTHYNNKTTVMYRRPMKVLEEVKKW